MFSFWYELQRILSADKRQLYKWGVIAASILCVQHVINGQATEATIAMLLAVVFGIRYYKAVAGPIAD